MRDVSRKARPLQGTYHRRYVAAEARTSKGTYQGRYVSNEALASPGTWRGRDVPRQAPVPPRVRTALVTSRCFATVPVRLWPSCYSLCPGTPMTTSGGGGVGEHLANTLGLYGPRLNVGMGCGVIPLPTSRQTILRDWPSTCSYACACAFLLS